MFNLTPKHKQDLSLGWRLAIALFLIVLGVPLLLSGYVIINSNSQTPDFPNFEKESKEPFGYPSLPWLGFYSMTIEPSEDYLSSEQKISIHVYATSDVLLENYFVHIFHSDLKDEFETSSILHKNGDIIKIPELKNEWRVYKKLVVGNENKCIPSSIPLKNVNDCYYDYNANLQNVFSSPGNYYILFSTEFQNQPENYLENGQIFSLKSPTDVELLKTSKTIPFIFPALEKANLRAEGFAYLGFGIAMIFGGVHLFDSYIRLKRKFAEDKLFLSTLLKNFLNYLRFSVDEYVQILAMARNTLHNDPVDRVHVWLTIKTNGLVSYADRTQEDVRLLQLRRADLHTDIIRIIQSNRILLNSSYFENIQHGFEIDTLITWIDNVSQLTLEMNTIRGRISPLIK